MAQFRREILANNEVYHILNHSIANEEIFLIKKDMERALNLIEYYRFQQELRYSQFLNLPMKARQNYISKYKKQSPLVEIYAYALMPNHYHLLLKQNPITGYGIRTFISNFQNSFAKYYNRRHRREGGLFLKPFKAKRMTDDNILVHVSRYIHLNPVTSYLIAYENQDSYPWTSYPCYLDKKKCEFVNSAFITKILGSQNKYEGFVSNQVDYQRKLNLIKNFILE